MIRWWLDPRRTVSVRTDLANFTEKLLTGRVQFEGLPPQAGAPSVATVPSVCWKCRRDIDLVVALVNLSAHTVFAPRRHPAGARSWQIARGSTGCLPAKLCLRCTERAVRSLLYGVRRPPALPPACARTVPGVTRQSPCTECRKRPWHPADGTAAGHSPARSGHRQRCAKHAGLGAVISKLRKYSWTDRAARC